MTDDRDDALRRRVVVPAADDAREGARLALVAVPAAAVPVEAVGALPPR
ncbi:hypothetical protein [Quadrisphaera sp. DSM 44207]|nr:hypothetical protein [Quadrisphaera sp. DSM 44207]